MVHTPTLTYTTLDNMLGSQVFVKAESLQHTGSFKFRGATNAVMQIAGSGASGVCTVSSGNHAQALARAAAESGIPAAVLMPEDSPQVKQKATASYGADIELYDRYSKPQDIAGEEFAKKTGYDFVSPYDDERVIAGAGTVTLEALQDLQGLDVLVVPIGGGGLTSGALLAARELSLSLKVIGVEARESKVWTKSVAQGRRVQIPVPRTIADGQQLSRPGVNTFEIVQRLGASIVCVTEKEILKSLVFLYERCKLVAEPSGAVALAALLARRVDVQDKRVGVILSGGNIGIDRLESLLQQR
jgi:threonine dehydratase